MVETKLAIFLPTYKRPNILLKVARNIEHNTHNPHKLYFGIELDDAESMKVLKHNKLNFYVNEYDPSFSNTIQTLYEHTDEPIFMMANDDFYFTYNWDEAPMKVLTEHGNIMVLGVHDGNPSNTKYSTISLVKRTYIEQQSGVIDMPRRVLYPYNHNFVDDEFTETAQARRVWDKLEAPCIIHQHHSFTWVSERNELDETYKKNDALAGLDTQTYFSRRPLWQNV